MSARPPVRGGLFRRKPKTTGESFRRVAQAKDTMPSEPKSEASSIIARHSGGITRRNKEGISLAKVNLKPDREDE